MDRPTRETGGLFFHGNARESMSGDLCTAFGAFGGSGAQTSMVMAAVNADSDQSHFIGGGADVGRGEAAVQIETENGAAEDSGEREEDDPILTPNGGRDDGGDLGRGHVGRYGRRAKQGEYRDLPDLPEHDRENTGHDHDDGWFQTCLVHAANDVVPLRAREVSAADEGAVEEVVAPGAEGEHGGYAGKRRGV